MLIGNQFDADKARYSRSYAYECWYNIEYEENSLGITTDEYQIIKDNWSTQMKIWANNLESVDQNEWDISDDAFDEELDACLGEGVTVTGKVAGNKKFAEGHNKGVEETKTAISFDGDMSNNKGKVALGGASSAVSVAAGGFSIAASISANAASAAAASAAQTAATATMNATIANNAAAAAGFKNVALNNSAAVASNNANQAKKAAQAAAETAKKAEKLSKALCYVGCTIALAVGTLYEVTKPNKDAYLALMDLKDLMDKSDKSIQQDIMALDTLGEEATTKASEAEEEEQEKQQALNDKTKLLILARAVEIELQNRMNAGEPISEADYSKFLISKSQIEQLAIEVSMMSQELGVIREEKRAEINDLNGEYDTKAMNIATAIGQADFAASFDEATRNLAIVEAITQGLNVASGGYNAVKAFMTGPWGIAFGVMGLAGAGMSLHGVIEQSTFANHTKDEIGVREKLQTSIGEALKQYDFSVAKQDQSLLNLDDVGLEGTELYNQTLEESNNTNVKVTEQNNTELMAENNKKETEKNQNNNPFV